MARESTLTEDLTRRALLDSTDDEEEQPVEQPPPPAPEPPPEEEPVQEPVPAPVERPVGRGQASWLPSVEGEEQPRYTEAGPQPAGGEAPRAQAVVSGPAELPESTDSIQVTHFGYAGDQFWDENSGRGVGDDENPLIPGYSVALTRSARQELLGVDSDKSTGKEVEFQGRKYRDDDTAPEGDSRLDVYDPLYQGRDEGVSEEMATARRKLSPPPAYDVRARQPGIEGGDYREPDITEQASTYESYGEGQRPIKGIILHSSDGSEGGDVQTLTGQDPGHQVSSHYYTTKDGRSHHFVADNDIAWHAGETAGPHAYLTNQNTIGIEQEHIDGQPWSDAEVRGTARTVAAILQRHPELTIDDVYGHSDIAPERKQDPLDFPWDRFREYVQGYQQGQAQKTVAQVQQTGQVSTAPRARSWLDSSTVPTPEENRYAIAQAQQKDAQQVSKLSEQYKDEPSLPGLIRKLDAPIPGVPDYIRQQFQGQAKDQLTKESQAYFSEPDPDKALQKGMSDVGLFEVAPNFWRKVLGGFQEYWLSGKKAQMPFNTAQTDINSFFAKAGINGDEQRHAFITQMNMMPVEEREKMLASMLPPSIPGVTLDANQPSTNPAYLARAFDKLNDPKWEQEQKKEIGAIQAQVDHNLLTDPRLKGTLAEIPPNIGAMVADTVAGYTPWGLPVLTAKIKDQLESQIHTEHPDWPEEKVHRAATEGALVAVAGQVGAQHLFGAVAEPLLNAIKAPVTRFLAKIGAGATGGGGIMAGGQALTNVLTGAPTERGVTEAGIMGALLGGGGAVLRGKGEYRPRGIERARAPLEYPEPFGPEAPLAEPEPHPYGPSAYPPPVPRPVTGAEILGPERAETAPTTARGPVVTRLTEGERVITPSILARAIRDLPEKATTEELRRYVENIRGEELEAPREVRFEPGQELQRPGIVRQVGENPLETFAREQLQQKTLPRARESILSPPAPGEIVTPKGTPAPLPIPPEGGRIAVSEIANRYVQPKLEPGEAILKGPSVSAQELINRGVRMHPEEIAQHVSNVMHAPDPGKQVSAVRTEESRLYERSRRLSKVARDIADGDPRKEQAVWESDNARKDWLDFSNGPVAQLKTAFHQIGRGLQKQHDIDLSTYEGMLEKYIKDVGEEPGKDVQETMKKMSKAVKDLSDQETQAKTKLDRVHAEDKKKGGMLSHEESKRRIMEKMKDVPCVVTRV